MSIDGTTSFTQVRDEIITDALANLGAVSPARSVADARSAGLIAHAARALNRVVKSIDADGQLLWRIVRGTANSVALDGSFVPRLVLSNVNSGTTFDVGAILDIDEPMTFAPSGTTQTRPIMAMSRDDYMAIADKTQAGEPSRYYVERTSLGLNSANPSNPFDLTVFVHPIPSGAFTLGFAAFVRAADMTTAASNPDFTSKWLSCLVYGLTAELAPAYRQPALATQFRQMFMEEKARLLANDTEREKTYLVPFGWGVY